MCVTCGCGSPFDGNGDGRNITMGRLLSAADAAGIPIEQAAKNVMATVLMRVNKEAGTDLAACRVVKASEERRYTLGVAYPAMKADVSRAADGKRDFVSPEVLEKTAWSWMAKHRDINLFHRSDEASTGHGTVVESYIYRGPDWVQDSPVDGKPYVVKAGDWCLACVWDEFGWALVKAGLVNGWSPEGTARRSIPSPERLALLRS